MAEGARLESVFTRKGNVGSNPTLSAMSFQLRTCIDAVFQVILTRHPFVCKSSATTDQPKVATKTTVPVYTRHRASCSAKHGGEFARSCEMPEMDPIQPQRSAASAVRRNLDSVDS